MAVDMHTSRCVIHAAMTARAACQAYECHRSARAVSTKPRLLLTAAPSGSHPRVERDTEQVPMYPMGAAGVGAHPFRGRPGGGPAGRTRGGGEGGRIDVLQSLLGRR